MVVFKVEEEPLLKIDLSGNEMCGNLSSVMRMLCVSHTVCAKEN